MVSTSIDVLIASLILATILGISLYAILFYSSIYESEALYLSCLSEAMRYSDFFLHTRDGIAKTRSDVLVYGLADCSRLPSAYSLALSKGFSGRVCCGDICAGPEGEYIVTLHRMVYWPATGATPFTISVCKS